MAQSVESGSIQIISYIRRKPSLTPAQFYDHWENGHGPKVIPWAEKHNIRRYQQVRALSPFLQPDLHSHALFKIHIAGKIVPSAAADSAPNAMNKGELPTEPIDFDGIAMFTVPSLEQFVDAFKDPYYIHVIEPDERVMLDKDGPGSGVLASFQGKMLDMVNAGKSTIGDKGKEYRDTWKEREKKN